MSAMPACIDCGEELVPFKRYGESAFHCPCCDGEDRGYWNYVFRNKNGVLGHLTICHHFVNVETNEPSRTFTPQVCWDCSHHETAEPGEYGSILSPPHCLKNVWPPTRSNKCKMKERRMAKC